MRYICEHCGLGGASGADDPRPPASYNCHHCGFNNKMWPEPIMRKLQEAQARVAELESGLNFVTGIGPQLTKAATLRKQAEAVELAANSNRLIEPHGDYCLYDDLIIDAQEIHQQADELEKADE